MAVPFVLTPGELALGDMRGLGGATAAELDPACHDVIDRASAAVDAIIAGALNRMMPPGILPSLS